MFFLIFILFFGKICLSPPCPPLVEKNFLIDRGGDPPLENFFQQGGGSRGGRRISEIFRGGHGLQGGGSPPVPPCRENPVVFCHLCCIFHIVEMSSHQLAVR